MENEYSQFLVKEKTRHNQNIFKFKEYRTVFWLQQKTHIKKVKIWKSLIKIFKETKAYMDSKNEYKTHGFWDKTLNTIMNKLITFSFGSLSAADPQEQKQGYL